jgi:hypothetical protein
MQYREKSLKGTAYLETDFLLFRGEERIKIPFKAMTAVEADGGALRLQFEGAEAIFELGAAASKWADKILHPPSRLDKLGVKPGSTVALIGEFAPDFLEELRARQAALVEGRGPAELLFFAAATRVDLARLPKLIARLAPRGALWIVYPKGVTKIREVEVIEAGRAAGLKDTKVAAFSAECTALKFQ